MDGNSKKKSKMREKRPSLQHSESHGKRVNNNQEQFKNELSSVVFSEFDGCNSPVEKVLVEANKIVQIGMAKEFAILERDTEIQCSNETIDNLRKNILHLQIEYEKLDQNYQNEISCRTEIIKRMETTRNIVESAAKYSSVLAKSVSQLEDDKLKLAEFYQMIYQEQKEVEEKHSKVEKFVKELEELLKTKFAEIEKAQQEISSENLEAYNVLNEKLSVALEENKNLLIKTDEFKKTINNLDTMLESKKQVVCSQQENIKKLKVTVKNLKVKNCKYQKLSKNKKRKVFNLNTRNVQMSKTLLNMEALYKESLTINQTLENENSQLKSEMETQLEFHRVQQQAWEKRTEELMKNLNEKQTENEKLSSSNMELEEKILNIEKKALELLNEKEIEKFHSNQLNENNVQILNENQELKEKSNLLYEENNKKNQLILDLESKLKISDSDLNLRETLYKKELEKSENLSKSLESQLCELQKKLSLERDKNEKVIAECDEKMKSNVEQTKEKISLLEEQLQEKDNKINGLNVEREKNMSVIQSLKIEVEDLKNFSSQKEEMCARLQSEIENLKKANNELCSDIKNERQSAKFLQKELDNAKIRLIDLGKEHSKEHSSNSVLEAEKNNLEKIISNMRMEIEKERKSAEQLKQVKAKLNDKINEIKKISIENSDLKSSVTNLKSGLEEAEARVEAFRVVVKKLETEKNESKHNHSQEISKLKMALNLAQEQVKKDKDFSNLLNLPQNLNESLQMEEAGMKQTKENADESPFRQRLGNKDGKGTPKEKSDVNESTATAVQNNKRFLSTPRKVLSAIPQSSLLYSTPIKKKKDPYEFDSDESIERFDPDQVLKVFNPRSKRAVPKRQKAKSHINM